MQRLVRTKTNREVLFRWFGAQDAIIGRVLDFCDTHYFADEPLNRSLGVRLHEADRRFCTAQIERMLAVGVSIAGVDAASDAVVAVMINDLQVRNKPRGRTDRYAYGTLQPGNMRYQLITDEIHRDIDLFGRHPNANTILDYSIGCVHPEWRQENLAHHAIMFGREVLEKQLKTDLAFGICSSPYTARVLSMNGFREIWSRTYHPLAFGDVAIETLPKINCMLAQCA